MIMRNFCKNLFGCIKRFEIIPIRCFGQPAFKTHPHKLRKEDVTPLITIGEYKSRRDKLLQLAFKNALQHEKNNNHIFLIPSASKAFMAYHVPYPFRQNTEFSYLCGFLEPDSVLVIHNKKDSSDCHAVLFVPKKDHYDELWEGARSGVEGTLEITGIDEAYESEYLGHYLEMYMRDFPSYMAWYDTEQHKNHAFSGKLKDFIKEGKAKCVERPGFLVDELRMVKSAAEIELLKKCGEISSEAFIEVMRYSHPQVEESCLEAKMDFEGRVRGADRLAYPPVIAGGNRGNTIHYIVNNQKIEDGEMCLMDAGCEYCGYTSDITRTWPINGKFSALQKDLYMLVLKIHMECIRLCTTDSDLSGINSKAEALLANELYRMGVIPSPNAVGRPQFNKIFKTFYPHFIGHYLGMDIHDSPSVSRARKLQPGNVVAIEPGLYIPHYNLAVPQEFRGIAIRIEDNVLITDSDPVVLSAKCPKHPDNLEKLASS